MKIQSLFDLVEDAKGTLEFFESVESPEQMISALERLKKKEAVEFLEQLQNLRYAVSQILEDTLEMGGFRPEDAEEDDDDGLGDLLGENEDEAEKDGDEVLVDSPQGSESQENQEDTTA